MKEFFRVVFGNLSLKEYKEIIEEDSFALSVPELLKSLFDQNNFWFALGMTIPAILFFGFIRHKRKKFEKKYPEYLL